MLNFNKTGYIYTNEKGEFLVRGIDRGFCDSTYHHLIFVKDFTLSCVFDDVVVIKDNVDSVTGLKYRTLFAEEVFDLCKLSKVNVTRGKCIDYLIQYI